MTIEDPKASGRRRAPKYRLASRLALALCLGVAAICVIAGIANVRLQRKHMTQLLKAAAERNADTILRSTREAMLRNRPAEVHRILASIGAQEGMERIRIFDKEGRVRISTWAQETDHVVDKRAEQCYGCHAADQPLVHLVRPDRFRTFLNESGERVLGVIAPIRNEPECTLACHVHSPDRLVLGVLDVQMSLGPVDDQLHASEQQLGLGLLLTLAAVLLMAWYLVWRMVLKPVRGLTLAARSVRAGDFAVRVPIHSPDEIGEMAASWNEMVGELTEARQELEEWSTTLEARVSASAREMESVHRRMLTVEKMASLGKLAAVVAHEINNPLAGIATYSRLLHRQLERLPDGPIDREEWARILEMIEQESVRCGKIVRNLLLFTRSPAAHLAERALKPLLERCVMLVQHKADLQGVEIALEIDERVSSLVCDEAQLQQLFLVLIINAIESMDDGGRLEIGARRLDYDHSIEVVIADTGRGIPAEHLDHVFEPFFSTKQDGPGVGLGLSVAYGIVFRHHGHIEVSSTVGIGTTFTVRLPLAQPDEQDGDAKEAEEVEP